MSRRRLLTKRTLIGVGDDEPAGCGMVFLLGGALGAKM